ncbi:methylthioribulose-1-phosphate dehydratase [Endobacter medicaginis]|jgi:methylthioribulose-1-phosphate dehydratase|uniref:Methylthioribulose-1-phosphate dehydratase n=1 Tax=Endobacter medicaginis TaxID=1181271 RepID=A0A839UW33_9PROT|nr:methylthioribulose 1-phosphate dehydratase [Endobacter medicaginis]MBB3174037.1 methylthioribulose-1-phosphate dehydratase [Endobacter medicaginis]MCX5477031.1 methylthioribulose 1-phosphate dehydratase [Endobacter medicaginis]NVN30507.1 methylthioribulose 1-phosphate dehydratase [Endobacter medicaginis]
MDGETTRDLAWEHAAASIIDAGRRLDRRGWVPATAGNISVRLADGRIAITRSGGHKGYLTHEHVIEIDIDGCAVRAGDRPSAETGLHTQVYGRFPQIGAVLHGHSVAATVLSRATDGDALYLEGYELQKAFAGQTTHLARLRLPVFDNDQDIARLARRIEPELHDCPMGYVLRGHGVYAWGEDMPTALARHEALEFLLDCELQHRKLR